jgi:hypothetical protein
MTLKEILADPIRETHQRIWQYQRSLSLSACQPWRRTRTGGNSTLSGGENHPAPQVINADEHAGYPPAIVRLKAEEALEENCRHRPVQYLNNQVATHPTKIKS